MSETLFLDIIKRKIPADIVFENEAVLGFRDLNAQAPIHVLFVPKIHIRTLNDLQPEQAELIGKLFLAARQYALEVGVAEQGYRTVINCNEDAGQTVFHIHLHFLAGRKFTWPPG